MLSLQLVGQPRLPCRDRERPGPRPVLNVERGRKRVVVLKGHRRSESSSGWVAVKGGTPLEGRYLPVMSFPATVRRGCGGERCP